MLAIALMLSVLPLLAIAVSITPGSPWPAKQGLIVALKVDANIIDRNKACLLVRGALDQGLLSDQVTLIV